MGLGMILWPVLLIGLIYLVLRPDSVRSWWGGQQSRPGSGKQDSPLEILRRRYARGEISREEFERLRREITQ